MSELVAMAAATTVARGVAKAVLYFNAWRRGDVAVAVAANSDTALDIITIADIFVCSHLMVSPQGIRKLESSASFVYNHVDVIE